MNKCSSLSKVSCFSLGISIFCFDLPAKVAPFSFNYISSNTNRQRSANTTAKQATMMKNNEIVTQISTYSHQLCLIKCTHKQFMFSPCSSLQADSHSLKIWIFKLLGDDKLRDHKTCGWLFVKMYDDFSYAIILCSRKVGRTEGWDELNCVCSNVFVFIPFALFARSARRRSCCCLRCEENCWCTK